MNFSEIEERFEPSLIKKRLDDVREELGKIPGGEKVKLLAATKTVPAEVINYTLNELGITAIGENRVQELLDKYDSIQLSDGTKPEIHFIGSLQTNKVKYIVDKVDMIESVDSMKLAAEIDRQAKKIGKIMDILVEVNIGEEEQKGGVMPCELFDFIDNIASFTSLRLRGLMTIAPKSDEKSDYLKYFKKTYQYFIDISRKNIHNINSDCFDTLSMGMSNSYAQAVAAGSTEVRLGTAIFGERHYSS